MEERAFSRRGTEPVTDLLKVPPQSIEAEQSVLGGLLLENQSWDRIADIITADDFYRREHRIIFNSISSLCEENSPADVVTVSEWLERSGELEIAGGLAYLGSLANNTPSAANIVAYAAIVRENSVMRELARAASDIGNAIYAPEGRSANELLDLAEKRIFDISEKGHRRGDFQPLNTLLSKAVDRIDELFRSKSSITGVATGFSDLDEMTSGLQKSDLIIIAGRPSMGKCIVAGSRLLDPRTGRLETIDQKVKQQHGSLVSLDRRGRLRMAAASHFVDDGYKPAYRVRTALGREISVTLTHPFLTLDGWRPLGKLSAGDFIAVPRALPFFGRRSAPEALVKLAAYFLTDGGLTSTVPKFTNAKARIRHDFIEATRYFPGLRCKLETSDGTRTPTVGVVRDFGLIRRTRQAFAARLRTFLYSQRISLHALARQLDVAVSTVHYWAVGISSPSVAILPRLQTALAAYPGAGDMFTSRSLHKNGSNPMTDWLRSLGLWSLDAHSKRVPDFVFELPQEQLALFLNRAFACDGSIYVQNGDQAGVSYSTVNLDLARDMQHLLLRFGLLAKLRVRHIRYRGERRTAYELRLTRQEDIRRFVNVIGLFGKERAATRALRVSLSKRPKVNKDTIPVGVWALIERKKGNRSWAELARALGYDDGFNLHVGKRGLSRARLRCIAETLDDEELRNLADADIYWDRIEHIEYLGRRQVYDLTVPDHHNFVAEDMLVHNTSLAMNMAENAAVGHKIPVAVFSMEMPGTQLALRMMASLGRINAHRVRTGKLDDDDWPRLTSAVSLLNEAPIFIDDSPGLTPMELRARARRLKREHGLGLIIIDYLQLMQSTERTEENRATEISNITRALKGLAKELDVPVIAMSQLNRSVESRTDKKPVMSDLRESGAIEQDADVILFIYRDEVYNKDSPVKGTADIIIGKQRNGPIGEVRLTFLGEYTRFENYTTAGYDGNN
ncbi:MAG: replicative DNA helicase [Sulfuricaulis sp.]